MTTGGAPIWRDVTNYGHPRAKHGTPLVFEMRADWMTIEVQHFDGGLLLPAWYLTCHAVGFEAESLPNIPLEAADKAKRRAVEMVTERMRRMVTTLGGYR